MTKRFHDKWGTAIQETQFPSLDGYSTLTSTKYANGSVQFSTFSQSLDVGDEEARKPTSEGEIGLKWQRLSELNPDHGLSNSFEVLFGDSFGGLGQKSTTDLISEIRDEVNESVWKRIKGHLATLGGEGDEHGHRRVFLVAAWAELFAEPFGEVWLSAMAQHAFYVLEDDFAFGYLIAQLDQKRENETHFLRGRKSLESAKLGGKVRSSILKPETERTLKEVKRLNGAGHSLSRSAEFAHRNGFGTSPSANKRLWNRHKERR